MRKAEVAMVDDIERTYLLEAFEGQDGWRWRAVAENGRIVATGAEAYASASNCRQAIERMIAAKLVHGFTKDDVKGDVT